MRRKRRRRDAKYKTLESGTFETLAAEEPRVAIDALQLAMLLGGVG